MDELRPGSGPALDLRSGLFGPAAFLCNTQSLVTHLYDLVTFEAGTTPDWAQVRALFIDEAVIVLRTSRDSSTVFSADGCIQDFISFIEQTNVEQTGFVERIVQMKPLVFKDIAHVLVLYEASIPGLLDRHNRVLTAFS